MHPAVLALCKPPVAVSTRVGPLAGVHPGVSSEVLLLRERLGADRTPERLVARVRADVVAQVGGVGGAVGAVRTLSLVFKPSSGIGESFYLSCHLVYPGLGRDSASWAA